MKFVNTKLAAGVFSLTLAGAAFGDGEIEDSIASFTVQEHAEIRNLADFSLSYSAGSGLFTGLDDAGVPQTDRDGAQSSSYTGSEDFEVIWNYHIDVNITADQSYFYLASLADPSTASDIEKITGITDLLAVDGGASSGTLEYNSEADGKLIADSASMVLTVAAVLGDVDAQQAGDYQRVYTITVQDPAP